MIKHIVMWKLVDSYEGMSKKDITDKLTEMFNTLPALIPAIRTLEVAANCNANETEADYVLITTHDSMDELKQYAVHPEHKKVGEFIGKVKLTRVCVDYEI